MADEPIQKSTCCGTVLRQLCNATELIYNRTVALACITGKQQHKTQAEASDHLRHIKQNHQRSGNKYGGKSCICQRCGFWHGQPEEDEAINAEIALVQLN